MNRKGMIFSIGLVIISLSLLIHAFFILDAKESRTKKGVGEQGIFVEKVSGVAENYRMYLDESARIAAKKAFSDFLAELGNCNMDCFKNPEKDYAFQLEQEFKDYFLPYLPHNIHSNSRSKYVPFHLGRGSYVSLFYNPNAKTHYAVEESRATIVSEDPLLFLVYHASGISRTLTDVTGIVLFDVKHLPDTTAVYSVPMAVRVNSPFSRKEWKKISELENDVKRECARVLEKDKREACVKKNSLPAKGSVECNDKCWVRMEYKFYEKDIEGKPFILNFSFELKPIITSKGLEELLPESACRNGRFDDSAVDSIKKIGGIKVARQPLEKGEKIIIEYDGKILERACLRG